MLAVDDLQVKGKRKEKKNLNILKFIITKIIHFILIYITTDKSRVNNNQLCKKNAN